MLEATPPADPTADWKFEYSFVNEPNRPRRTAPIVENTEDALTLEVPIEQPHPPGIKARVRVKTSYWNHWHTGFEA